MTRCVVIVFDSCGIGALRDAATSAKRAESNTIGNVGARVGAFCAPNCERGFECLPDIRGVAVGQMPAANVANRGETSKVEDTITGRRGTAGIHTDVPFPTYRGGFPPAVVAGFANRAETVRG